MLLFQSLTNKKNTKTYSESVVIAGPTSGELKLTPMAAEVLGVKEGDNLAVLVNDGKVYIGKGINGIPMLGADGKQLKTKTGKKVCEPNTSFGATLGAQENSVLLKASAQAGWDTLGGKTTANVYFTIDEPVEGQVPTGNKDANGEDILHTGLFFGLTYKETKEKAPRKTKDGEITPTSDAGAIGVAPDTDEEEEDELEDVQEDVDFKDEDEIEEEV